MEEIQGNMRDRFSIFRLFRWNESLEKYFHFNKEMENKLCNLNLLNYHLK